MLLSARRVGPTGKAFGLDMTDEMLALALANTAKAGSPTEFLKGTIEACTARKLLAAGQAAQLCSM